MLVRTNVTSAVASKSAFDRYTSNVFFVPIADIRSGVEAKEFGFHLWRSLEAARKNN